MKILGKLGKTFRQIGQENFISKNFECLKFDVNLNYKTTNVMSLFFADEDGAYYWHVKSGTIQREPPPPPPPDYTAQRSISSDVSNCS